MLTGEELSPAPSPRVGRLNTLQAVRRELSRVYREARTGKIDTADASRLGLLLVSLAKIMESSDLEQRIEALEKLTSQHELTTRRH